MQHRRAWNPAPAPGRFARADVADPLHAFERGETFDLQAGIFIRQTTHPIHADRPRVPIADGLPKG